ncbi:MAG: PIG-L family deacetylase [Phycisphaerae bacterium]|nr:PIG-L family deacetylase [Phycisphaerae bacterium]
MEVSEKNKIAFAAAAHPDDIEFMMGGTFALLGRAGWRLHYMNIANGSCGSTTLGPEEIAAVRTAEAQKAAGEIFHAEFHPPLVNDLEIFYTPELVAKLCAVVREVQPTILLVPSPQDYMEDHMNVSRLMVTAAFMRAVPNFPVQPPRPPTTQPTAVYHAMPYGLTDQLRRPITPHFHVNVESVMDVKREALRCHESQKTWLDETQGLDNYLHTMEDVTARMGKMSGTFTHAESWRRHSHMGFATEEFDPLYEALQDFIQSA